MSETDAEPDASETAVASDADEADVGSRGADPDASNGADAPRADDDPAASDGGAGNDGRSETDDAPASVRDGRPVRETRWRGGLVAATAATLLGVAFGAPSAFLLGIVGLGFVAIGYASSAPSNDLRLERTVDDERVRPGRSVTVSLTVHNEGERIAPDVRVADEPPEDVPVTGGNPAFATALRPGESVTREYELTPPRGEYGFGEPTVRRRTLTGAVRTTAAPTVDGTTAFTCETLLDTFPLRDRAIQFVGQRPTDDGGSGVEFFSTREYRRGDPINRIDWHRFARTGRLATVEYREDRAVTVVFVIDDREGAHRQPPGGGPDSFDLSLYAASRGVVASIEDGNRTGFATLSGDAWIAPGADAEIRQRVEDAVGERAGAGTSPEAGSPSQGAGEPARADGGTAAARLATDLAERLPRDAQVVFCSPVADEGAVAAVERLRSLGRAVSVVAPDPTTAVDGEDDSPATRIVGLERENRLEELRGLGTTVVDWELGDALSIELARVIRARNGGRSV